jgi:hypothetical protein
MKYTQTLAPLRALAEFQQMLLAQQQLGYDSMRIHHWKDCKARISFFQKFGKANSLVYKIAVDDDTYWFIRDWFGSEQYINQMLEKLDEYHPHLRRNYRLQKILGRDSKLAVSEKQRIQERAGKILALFRGEEA